MGEGRISEIWRYPVKSMGGERIESAELGEQGLPGDRAWAVRDEVRGGIRGAKKIAALMRLSARYPSAPASVGSSPAEITLPDGATLATDAPDVGARLSAALEHAVTLWPLLPADALEHYRRGAPDHADFMEELRAMFGRAPDEPLPDISIFPREVMEFESPPGTYFDCFPLLLMTEASLRSMAAAAPDSVFDVRRFRPNLLITDVDGTEAFPEQAWRGRRLAIGEAILEVTVECPRCVMVTHGFSDLPKDPSVMRALVKNADGNLGVYAKVVTPGRIGLGDSVRLLA